MFKKIKYFLLELHNLGINWVLVKETIFSTKYNDMGNKYYLKLSKLLINKNGDLYYQNTNTTVKLNDDEYSKYKHLLSSSYLSFSSEVKLLLFLVEYYEIQNI